MSIGRALAAGALLSAFVLPPLFAQPLRSPLIRGEVPALRAERLVVPSAQDDSWTGFDKVQHFTFSFLWLLGSQYVLVNKLEQTERRALPLSVMSAAAAGLGKEIYDYRSPSRRHFCLRDLAVDGAGVGLAAILVRL